MKNIKFIVRTDFVRQNITKNTTTTYTRNTDFCEKRDDAYFAQKDATEQKQYVHPGNKTNCTISRYMFSTRRPFVAISVDGDYIKDYATAAKVIMVDKIKK